MFHASAEVYDAIYADKDYRAESARIHEMIQQHRSAANGTLLDVACGTGRHLHYLKEYYDVEGLDLDERLLQIARERLPGTRFHLADMQDFDVGRKFDVITCLFSSIGYAEDYTALTRIVGCMARHLEANGIIIIEPWFSEEQWTPGRVDVVTVDDTDRTIIRLDHADQDGKTSIVTFHYLIGTAEGIEHAKEEHRLTLFSADEYQAAFKEHGFAVEHDAAGIAGRGAYLCWQAGP